MIVSADRVQTYLRDILGKKIKLRRMSRLGVEAREEGLREIKGYGYGEPLLLEVEVNDEMRKLVLHTVKPGGFGHEYPSDRAKMLLWAHSAYNKIPRHARSLDVGVFRGDGSLITLGGAEEFFLLTEYVEGEEYFKDLERIRMDGELTELDEDRATILADYISLIHSSKGEDPELYVRRIRELLGHGEAIMGLLDSYDPNAEFLEPRELIEIEKRCVEWRWKMKKLTHRLCQVHGDYHPWNVKFRSNLDFTVLDRSRGEWGEAADDVSCMAINYLFFSIQEFGRLEGPFERLWNLFLERYLANTRDQEIMEVVAPFFAWRGLVIASPIWYPKLKHETRRKIFNFIGNVLEVDIFEPQDVNSYLKGK